MARFERFDFLGWCHTGRCCHRFGGDDLSLNVGLSVVLCVRHNMQSERTMYAETCKEDAESQSLRVSGAGAEAEVP